MAKWHGVVGYAVTEETVPGVWKEIIEDHEYSGDLIPNRRQLQNDQKVNDDVTLSNELSIVADPFAYENYLSIRYVTVMGHKWKVNSVEVQYPRLVLSLGGVWNAVKP